MNNKYISGITAVTEVLPQGQKCVRAVIEMDRELECGTVDEKSFSVTNRNITAVAASGKQVILELNPEDEEAAVYHSGNFRTGEGPFLTKAEVTVTQKKELRGMDGTRLKPQDCEDSSNAVVNLPVDDFIQGEYEGLKYNLYIPKEYHPEEKYPIVQFIHDAGSCGGETKLTLTQGIGAVVWAGEREQAKHPCFVFAPQFDGPPVVDDEWNVDARLETAKTILDRIIETYSIDKNRIYTTGQSMGCMASIVLNVRYPEFFAASLLVAGQWDEHGIEGLEKQRLWMMNSQGDAKAFPIMNQMNVQMEQKGAKIAHMVWSARLTQEEYKEIAEKLTATGANIIYTPYRMETVANGWHSNGGEHHVSTWATAYQIEAVRDWLFTNHR